LLKSILTFLKKKACIDRSKAEIASVSVYWSEQGGDCECKRVWRRLRV